MLLLCYSTDPLYSLLLAFNVLYLNPQNLQKTLYSIVVKIRLRHRNKESTIVQDVILHSINTIQNSVQDADGQLSLKKYQEL